ncbi:exodeoxyribonuclease VII small subunit [Caproiciproducens sp.]|uniref:exodeoxyribonuclease VII small subunit n=1 Tax=Caproiciproducens sp. TaxID=1954376 RepID=UPI00289C98D3|nr:exodeoxyribonuclease VII small subunit [Caproiciproducens sp.]
MNKKMTFEDAMAKLNEIVGQLENGSESLESSLKLFEEGSALAALCYGKLESAEQKIRQITDFEEVGGEKNA